MLMWGNAFVFNKKMVAALREQWKSVGIVESGKSVAVGCPQFMRGRQELSSRAVGLIYKV